ncbi:MAG: hypothetical protein ACOCWJ_04630 [Verrucomicrobiota bacterium]
MTTHAFTHYSHDNLTAPLYVAVDAEGTWEFPTLEKRGDGQWRGDWTIRRGPNLCTGRLTLQLDKSTGAYDLEFESSHPVRVRLSLGSPVDATPYHLLPGVLFGDNNLANVTRRIFPHLTRERPELVNCSTYWEFRADRCSLPVSLMCFDGGVAAVSCTPYTDVSDEVERETGDMDFVKNGVIAQLATGTMPASCSASCGYRNLPATYLAKGNFLPITEHRTAQGRMQGRLFLRAAKDRLAIHGIIEELYAELREPPQPRVTRSEAARILAKALVGPGWHEEDDNCYDWRQVPGTTTKENFRGANDDIAWTGGMATAYPLLLAGEQLELPECTEKALRVIDRIADPASINPATGLLWDVVGKRSGRHANGWWAGAFGAHHFAYTNGEALSYILKAYRLVRDRMDLDRETWLHTVERVLETVLSLQRDDGGFPYAVSTEDGSVTVPEGFAGCWFAAALAEAYDITGNRKYLDAALRSVDYYRAFVRDLNCWGTPMDTSLAVDQEGILSFIRATARLYQSSGESRFKEMLDEGARYEYLWRFGFRTRPDVPPLKDSRWNSCGGSLTSVSNPHIHPMGILVSGELAILAKDSEYHRKRLEDGLDWSALCSDICPDLTGYGELGVVGERFCPSDGLLSETYADGTPASIWFTYHPWGASCMLEGLLDTL